MTPQDSMATQIEAMAAKYDQATEAVHPAEVVNDLTTILESGENQNNPSTDVDTSTPKE